MKPFSLKGQYMEGSTSGKKKNYGSVQTCEVEIPRGIGRVGDLFKVVQEVFQLPAVRRQIFWSKVIPSETKGTWRQVDQSLPLKMIHGPPFIKGPQNEQTQQTHSLVDLVDQRF